MWRPRLRASAVVPAPVSATTSRSRRPSPRPSMLARMRDLAAPLLARDAMLDGVLDERLQHERRETNVAQPRRHGNRHPEPLFEAGALDVEVRLDQLEFPPERRDLALRAQHGPEQAGQPQEGLERPGRRGLNEIADRGERVEQEVRVDLGP